MVPVLLIFFKFLIVDVNVCNGDENEGWSGCCDRKDIVYLSLLLLKAVMLVGHLGMGLERWVEVSILRREENSWWKGLCSVGHSVDVDQCVKSTKYVAKWHYFFQLKIANSFLRLSPTRAPTRARMEGAAVYLFDSMVFDFNGAVCLT